MTFAAPLWLWGLLTVPLLLILELWATRRDRERTALLVARPLWARVVRQPRELWRWARLVLLALGAVALVTALARPQWGIVREKIEREGVDVVLVLDASGSMATTDVQPNRFFLARSALAALIDRLAGDRFALIAFEGEAYPLVPLTLDADAIGLFLDTLEPGVVPAPGTSVGVGLSRGLDMFVDTARNNKVMILISDGEDLEGEVAAAVAKAKAAGVIVHTVGVGTEKGAPVPDFDADGKQAGFKKDVDGSAVVSRLHPETLQAIARATGGAYVQLRGADTSLWQLAATIEGMEQKTLAREYSYRKQERYQLPLGFALLAFGTALLIPLPALRRSRAANRSTTPRPNGHQKAGLATFLFLLAGAEVAWAEGPGVGSELLLRPQRYTVAARKQFAAGDHPRALESFEKAAAVRPSDARIKLNLADALYKNGKYAEAAEIFRALGANAASPLAAAARFNLGDSLFQQKEYAAAARAFRDALALAARDEEARRNLELALRAIEEQKQQQQQQPSQDHRKQEQQQQQQKEQPNARQSQQQEPRKSEEQKEQERFQRETGMPKERAMQLLDALQQNEKEEQRRQLALLRGGKKKGKDW